MEIRKHVKQEVSSLPVQLLDSVFLFDRNSIRIHIDTANKNVIRWKNKWKLTRELKETHNSARLSFRRSRTEERTLKVQFNQTNRQKSYLVEDMVNDTSNMLISPSVSSELKKRKVTGPVIANLLAEDGGFSTDSEDSWVVADLTELKQQLHWLKLTTKKAKKSYTYLGGDFESSMKTVLSERSKARRSSLRATRSSSLMQRSSVHLSEMGDNTLK